MFIRRSFTSGVYDDQIKHHISICPMRTCCIMNRSNIIFVFVQAMSTPLGLESSGCPQCPLRGGRLWAGMLLDSLLCCFWSRMFFLGPCMMFLGFVRVFLVFLVFLVSGLLTGWSDLAWPSFFCFVFSYSFFPPG